MQGSIRRYIAGVRLATTATPLLTVALLGLQLVAASAQATPAEYALRWRPDQGGPGDAASVRRLLVMDPVEEGPAITVAYFVIDAPAASGSARPIVRQRDGEGKTETTVKYRWATMKDPSILSSVSCPLAGKTKSKFEVDISVLSDEQERRMYSWSCETKAPVSKALAGWHASPVGCSSMMRRWRAAASGVKLEEWRTAKGTVTLEISWSASDSAQSLASFRARALQPLLKAGIKPLELSKTESGEQC